jgi:hypothetical protein
MQQHTKEIIHHDKVGFIPWMQSFTYTNNKHNPAHDRIKDKNHMLISINVKSLGKNSTYLHDRS